MAEVSVVIPTRDRSGLLAVALHTALWQEDIDLEVIVVDDGSTDTTPDVLAGMGDARVRPIRHDRPMGVSAARNHGIERARGRWIAFLDDDDLWAPDKVSSQIAAAEEARRAWAYAGAVKIDARRNVVGGTPPPDPGRVVARLPRWNLVPGGCSGVIATRPALAATGGFDTGLINLADWDLWIRLGHMGPPACAPAPLVGYRLHPGQASLDARLILEEAKVIEGRSEAALDWGGIHHYLAHRCLRSGSRREAGRHFLLAAAAGEVGPVARSLWAMGRDRVLPGRLRRPDPHARWRARADTWLRLLDPVAPASDPGAR